MSINQINECEEKQLALITAKEVLEDKELQKLRYQKLVKAMKLWNLLRQKSKIIFKTGEEIKSICTPVWFVSEKHVCIHAGMTVLVSCIFEVID